MHRQARVLLRLSQLRDQVDGHGTLRSHLEAGPRKVLGSLRWRQHHEQLKMRRQDSQTNQAGEDQEGGQDPIDSLWWTQHHQTL